MLKGAQIYLKGSKDYNISVQPALEYSRRFLKFIQNCIEEKES
jgi:hypothetical protein